MLARARWILCGLLLLPLSLTAQNVTVSGQVRPRTEVRDPAGATGGSRTWTSMRTRIAASFAPSNTVRAFVQLQDVRIFGEESNTLSDFRADNLDLHQGWVQVGRDDAGLSLRAGRQELSYGGQRLIGAVGWAQQGRAFDGARLRAFPSERAQVDVLGIQLSESFAASRDADATFWGAYGVIQAGAGRSLDLFALRQGFEAADADTKQWTAGLRYVATDGGFTYRVEGAVQTGERGGQDVSAHLLGARVGRDFADGKAGLTLWADLLSGTDPTSSEVGSFDTLFGTNHKFYGYADLFLNIPVHTSGRGLVDLAVKGRWQVHSDWTASIDVHRFTVAESAGLESSSLGTEIDLTLARAAFSGVRISGGAARVLAGDALGPVRGIFDDVTFAYLMLDVVF